MASQASTSRRARRADAPRRHRVYLKFNDVEYGTLVVAATGAGLSPGAYASTAALAVAREEVHPAPVDEKERLRTLAEARVAVNRIGNNLNQIAHVLNADGVETPERLAAVLERVEQAVRTLDDATVAVLEGRA